MKLSSPTKLVFIISAALFVLALLGNFGVVTAVAGYAVNLLIAAWVVLALGCLLKGV